jgi:hypothetical protein
MILNLLVLAIVLGVTVSWGLQGKGRGVFSSFLTMLCVIVSGAVALGVWEPLVYGFLLDLRPDIAWAVGLAGPFIITLVATRAIMEFAVPKNLDVPDAANFAGGAAFGLVSGVVTAGIVVLSLLYLRGGPQLLGHQAIADEQGRLSYEKSLWVPVDRLTVKLYEHVSMGAFATGTPLATRAPDLHEQAAIQRMNYFVEGDKSNSFGSTAYGSGDFDVKGRYAVEGGQRAEGFVIEFKSGAKEDRSGQVVIGPGQVRLIGERNGEPWTGHPNALIAQPDAAAAGVALFPAEKDMHVASVGGASTASFGFEFAVPAGVELTDLLVKSYRVTLADEPGLAQAGVVYDDRTQANAEIASGALFEAFGLSVGGLKIDRLDTSEAETVDASSDEFRAIRSQNRLPQNWIINTTTGTGGLKTRENAIEDGQHIFGIDQLKARGLDRNLQVFEFATTRDTGIIQVEVVREDKRSIFGRAIQAAEGTLPPLVVDTDGNAYECVGYVYSDGRTVEIRYTPGDPIRALSQTPSVSTTKRDQTLFLVFRPTAGAQIEAFVLGNKAIATYDPPVEVRTSR